MRDTFSLLETRLFDSKWVKIETGRGISTLTLPNLYKDDEGLYTLRMVTKGGTAGHSAFVSVSGEAYQDVWRRRTRFTLVTVTHPYLCRRSSSGAQRTWSANGLDDPRCQQRLRHCVMEASKHHHRGSDPGILCRQVRNFGINKLTSMKTNLLLSYQLVYMSQNRLLLAFS